MTFVKLESLQPTTSEKVFEESFQVGNTLHRYRVIRIWECDPTPLLSQPELLPLAVLAKSEQPSRLLSQVAERIDGGKLSSDRVCRIFFRNSSQGIQ